MVRELTHPSIHRQFVTCDELSHLSSLLFTKPFVLGGDRIEGQWRDLQPQEDQEAVRLQAHVQHRQRLRGHHPAGETEIRPCGT